MPKKKNIVIIHYNTPLLTGCLVKSINKFVKDAIIYVFDNSDKHPFTSKCENVTILDNTKGQIIDFDKWLDKYKDKNKSHGRVNKWASAKHCYSIEKCMEIVKEPFVLLDSDVLLKRDISNLYRDDCMYIGEASNQPRSTIKRILPYICYINTTKCRMAKVHYFDENYMHGLNHRKKNFAADSYDTGAGFYVHAHKFKHVDIKLDEYVVHFKHGSWDKKDDAKVMTDKEWLSINKKYWSNEVNKKVIYTCVTGGYDTITEPTYITPGFDYICFTDNENLTSKVWKIMKMPPQTEGLSQVKKQRYVKINAHKILSKYDISIWVDGNVCVKGDLNTLLDKYYVNKSTCSVFVPKHPQRQCVYDEARVVLAMKKDKPENVNPQIERYKKEGFPAKYGMLQSNIMIRKHNDEKCIKLMETWFNELKKGSHRDQLSFNYACWKNKDVDIVYMDKYIYKSTWFRWTGVHKKCKTSASGKVTAKYYPSTVSNKTNSTVKLNATEMSNALSLY